MVALLAFLFGFSIFAAALVIGFAFSETYAHKKSVSSLGKYSIEEIGAGLDRPFLERAFFPYLEKISKALSFLSPSQLKEYYDVRLLNAGSPLGLNGEKYLTLKTIIAAGAGSVFFVLSFVLRRDILSSILVGLSSAVFFYLLPDLVLSLNISGRQKRIRKELPDLMDLLVISIEAGLGFDSALAKVIKHGRGPIAYEFSRTLYEIQIGVSRKDAFRNLHMRTGVDELRRLANTITMSDLFGISVSSVLRSYAEELRNSRKNKAQERAQKVGVKITFPLILCIFPVMFIVIIGPAVIQLFSNF